MTFAGCTDLEQYVLYAKNNLDPTLAYLRRSDMIAGHSPVGKLETPEDLSIAKALLQSPTFSPRLQVDEALPDTLLLSSDSVSFSVHAHRLLRASANQFAGLLWKDAKVFQERPPFIAADENAIILTIVLDVFYEFYAELKLFAFDTLVAAITSLRKYGVCLQQVIAPHTPFMERLLDFAPIRGIELYAVAAENNLEALAVAASSYVLNFSLTELSDELAVRMGSGYLIRLYDLQVRRRSSLRSLLLSVFGVHPPCTGCSMLEQKRLSRAWALAAAQLAWDAGPGACPF